VDFIAWQYSTLFINVVSNGIWLLFAKKADPADRHHGAFSSNEEHTFM